MDLQKAWKKLEHDKLEKPVLGSVHIVKESKHPVEKLKLAYLISALWSAVFLLVMGYLFFQFDQTLVRVGLGVTQMGLFLSSVINFLMYKKIKAGLPIDRDLKNFLRYTYDSIRANIQFQERAALFFYPIAGMSGYFLGMAAAGTEVASTMQEPFYLCVLAITMVSVMPLGWFCTRWSYRISYDVWLKELKQRIDELEKPLPPTNLPV